MRPDKAGREITKVELKIQDKWVPGTILENGSIVPQGWNVCLHREQEEVRSLSLSHYLVIRKS